MKIRYFSKCGLNFIEVSNNSHLMVTLCDLGASVFQIRFDKEMMTRNVIELEDYLKDDCYYGKTIGRTSNRLKGHVFEIENNIYHLDNNEGDNVLHGGREGLSTKVFSPSVKTYGWYTEVRYKYFSKHLEGGYPGNISIDVIYLIYQDIDRIDIRYEASSDLTTLFSLTNHSYFCLGEKDISHLELYLRSNKFIRVHPNDLLPIRIEPMNKVFDFRKYKNLSLDIFDPLLQGKLLNGYDHYFYFDDINPKKISASLRSKKYRLDIFTNYEGIQVYTSNQPHNYLVNKENIIHDAVALEPSDTFFYYPVLKSNEKYIRGISYIFLKRE